MNNEFKVGDKVLCVDSTGMAEIKTGQIYEVKGVYYGHIRISISTLKNDSTWAYGGFRFKLVPKTELAELLYNE